MYGTIIYIVLGLATSAFVFELLVRHEMKDWGHVDSTDIGFMALISILLGTIFPLVVVGFLIYNFLLQPIVIRINKEKDNVHSVR
jgi:hypothetical protein